MPHSITQKPVKLKQSRETLRLPAKKMRRAAPIATGETLASKKDPAELSVTWEKAQVQIISGKTATLKLDELSRWTARFSNEEIGALVIPKRTLARRKAKHETLTLEETDKALRLARISSEADRVFGDPEKSARWLRQPNSALSGQTPLELLKSETGAIAVNELLGQIDHGMFV